MLVSGVSKKGGRPSNEDSWGEVRIGDILCVVVADGLGGHKGGMLASRIAVDTVISQFTKAPGFSSETVKELAEAANAAVREKAGTDPELVRMATTIVILLIKGRNAVWANVGDSRLYRFEEDMIAEVTEDHSLAFADFMNGVTEYDDIRRSDKQNMLTNALGLSFGSVSLHNPIELAPVTAFLLCTDGWWEHVNEEQMEQTLMHSKNTRAWIDAMLKIHDLNAPETCDNYTAAAIIL
ncbi:MAG: serine/threonine-protein phosphatase [Clostridia bacterium]|nr:serine/threonine-protein phosphatase [Clostridia bacterium]